MIRLAGYLERIDLPRRQVADELGVSPASLSSLCRHGRQVRRLDPEEVVEWLVAHGILRRAALRWAEPVEGRDSDSESTDPLAAGASAAQSEDTEMLISAQRLTLDERVALGLERDPFFDEVREHADLYLTPRQRMVREAMWQAAQHRGFLAVVGESGSGKTILRRDILERARREDPSIVPIMPYVLGMEEHDGRGPSLRATDIAEMIVRRLEPTARLRSTRQGRYDQAESVLAERVRSGQKPVLLVEEAHGLPKSTLRHLKRFSELEAGYARLLGIILLGQTELADRLSETDPTIREVVQRCEVVRLPPLADESQIGGYLRHKIARAGGAPERLLSAGAVEAIRDRLTVRSRRTGQAEVSLCYPLAIQNLVVNALRAAMGSLEGWAGPLLREHVEAV
jgi:type II secretory pathway predicted ATPase ExeA